MFKSKTFLAIIPARGSSKSIPKKNIIGLRGKPLIYYSIDVAWQSKYIDRAIVSSDDREILSVAEKYGAEIIKRPKELAQDNSRMDEVIRHVLSTLGAKDDYKPDFIILLQPTNPLRRIETVDKAIELFTLKADRFDSLIPLYPIESKIGRIKNNTYKPLGKLGLQRQEIRQVYRECGVIFIFKPEVIRQDKFYGEKIYPFIIENVEEAIDIDSYEDLDYANYLKKKNERNNYKK